MNEVCLVLNGIGRVIVDLEHHILTPANPAVSYRLWSMVQCAPRKAALRMSQCEDAAAQYAEDDDPWFWDLPVPADYQLCPCCMC